jgi:4-amino-4-deoxy-L-arabinose transferase-like glycosyltransferase
VTQDRHWHGEAQMEPGWANPGLADFLQANQGSARFLAATANARQAAPLIIATGVPVLALGGFQGSLPVVTLSVLRGLVGSGQLRFVLLAEPQQTPAAGQGRRDAVRRTAVQQAISAWVHERGVLVDPDRWHATDAAADAARPAVARLYDLAGAE